MKKIEQQMCEAIKQGDSKHLGNTQVKCYKHETLVYLFGNLIAIFKDGSVKLTNAGYPTYTTHSRLRAIVDGFRLPLTIKGHKGDTLFITPQETHYQTITVGL